MRKNRKSKRNGGESIVFVVILLFVFMALGLALLSAGFATRNGAVQRERQMQSYYYARSVLDSLDDSLQAGELGGMLRQIALEALGDETEAVFSGTLEMTASLPQAADLEIEAITLRYSGKASAVLDGDGQVVRYYYAFDKLELPIQTGYYGALYTLDAVYNGYGWGALEDGEWRWSTAWTAESLN